MSWPPPWARSPWVFIVFNGSSIAVYVAFYRGCSVRGCDCSDIYSLVAGLTFLMYGLGELVQILVRWRPDTLDVTKLYRFWQR